VTGAVLDKYTVVYPNGLLVPRRFNAGWQAYLFHYLTSARAFIICREPSDGMNPAYLHDYGRFPVVIATAYNRTVMRLGQGPAS
jgi:hypothetical protein